MKSWKSWNAGVEKNMGASMNTALEVSMHVARHGLIALVVKRDGRVDESYWPVPVDVALEAAGYLIRGVEPPRVMFSARANFGRK